MEEIHPNPPEIHSFLVNRILHADITDFSKKRKVLDKQLSLPTRKLKFRDASHECEQSSLSTGETEAEADPSPRTTTWMMNLSSNVLHDDDESTQPESEMDSNSFEETDCALSHSTEVKSEPEVSKVCTHDKPVSSKREFPVYACDKPSSSSGSCGSNNSKDTLYSLDNRSFKKLRVGKEAMEEEALHLGFGYDTDYICSEKVICENEECMNLESDEEVVIYPSGMSSDLFVLSSGRWKINQDAQVGVRKPTIDQEFEQYFSTLML